MRTLLGFDPLLLSQLISVTLRAAKWIEATNMDGCVHSGNVHRLCQSQTFEILNEQHFRINRPVFFDEKLLD